MWPTAPISFAVTVLLAIILIAQALNLICKLLLSYHLSSVGYDDDQNSNEDELSAILLYMEDEQEII